MCSPPETPHLPNCCLDGKPSELKVTQTRHLRPWAAFLPHDRAKLKSCFGLTDAQVLWLGKSLVSIADLIRHKPTATAVFDELEGLRKELTIARKKPGRRSDSIARAQKRLKRWQSAARLVAGVDGLREAMGHVGMAWAGLECQAPIVVEPSGDELMLAALVDEIAVRLVDRGSGTDEGSAGLETVSLIAFALAVADRAVADRPILQRRPVASALAIDYIVDALNRPDGEASADAARRLQPTWEDAGVGPTELPRAGSFGALATLIFAHVTQTSDASPARSIRKYMKGISTPRPAGRPPKTG